jgi:hypothetical protein
VVAWRLYTLYRHVRCKVSALARMHMQRLRSEHRADQRRLINLGQTTVAGEIVAEFTGDDGPWKIREMQTGSERPRLSRFTNVPACMVGIRTVEHVVRRDIFTVCWARAAKSSVTTLLCRCHCAHNCFCDDEVSWVERTQLAHRWRFAGARRGCRPTRQRHQDVGQKQKRALAMEFSR